MKKHTDALTRVSGPGYELVAGFSEPKLPDLLVVSEATEEVYEILAKRSVERLAVKAPVSKSGALVTMLELAAPVVTSLSVTNHGVADLSVLEEFRCLRELKYSGTTPRVDWSRLAFLEELDFAGNPGPSGFGNIKRLRKCSLAEGADLDAISAGPALEDLYVWDSKARDLSAIAGSSLVRLTLNSPRVLASLDGIPQSLEELDLVMPSRLQSIGSLADLKCLHTFRLDGGKKISDAERLGEIASLEKLAITNGPSLPSLRFVAGLSNLESLLVNNTKVATVSTVEHFTGLSKLTELILGAGTGAVIDPERLGELRNLEVLVVRGTPAIASFAFVRDLKSLKSFSWEGKPVRDGSLDPFRELPLLERLDWLPAGSEYASVAAEIQAILGRTARPSLAGVADVLPHAASATVPSKREAGVILPDIVWRYQGDRFTSMSDFSAALIEAQVDASDAGGTGFDSIALAAPRCTVIFDDPTTGVDTQIDLIADGPQGFSVIELMYKLHNAVVLEVSEGEHVFHEGLAPISSDEGRPARPSFRLRLGS